MAGDFLARGKGRESARLDAMGYGIMPGFHFTANARHFSAIPWRYLMPMHADDALGSNDE